MQNYLDLLQQVFRHGIDKADRTGTGTRSVFGHQMRFDLSAGFPLLTTKKVHLKSVIYELLWFLRGDTNVRWLQQHGVSIWDEWADTKGDLGPVYGYQWRHWMKTSYKEAAIPFPVQSKRNSTTRAHEESVSPTPLLFPPEELPIPTVRPSFVYGVFPSKEIDQINQLVANLKQYPDSRRHIVTAWNPSDVDDMKLPPCHLLFQFYVAQGRLSCQLYQRSADLFLGVPFNIASYALLVHMVAQVCDLQVGEFIWTGGDCHLYHNHFDQAKLQQERTPRPLPTLQINPDVKDIFQFRYEDFTLGNYDPHPAIKAPVAV